MWLAYSRRPVSGRCFGVALFAGLKTVGVDLTGLAVLSGAIGVGLLSTLTPDSGHAKWIGYQCIAGIGIGFGMQQPLIVSTFPFCYCQRSRFSDQNMSRKSLS